MYNHILVPVAIDHEGRGPAMLKVAETLLAEGGKITLLNVNEPVPGYVSQHIPPEVLSEEAKIVAAALKDLSAMTDKAVETKVARGSPARTIVDVGAKLGADCIVIASHHPELTDYLIGSTAAWVARHADCGVHIIR